MLTVKKDETKHLLTELEMYQKHLSPLVGCWNVGLSYTDSNEEFTTQGDIPDKEYTWDDFNEWLIQDIREMKLDFSRLTLDYIEYAGKDF